MVVYGWEGQNGIATHLDHALTGTRSNLFFTHTHPTR